MTRTEGRGSRADRSAGATAAREAAPRVSRRRVLAAGTALAGGSLLGAPAAGDRDGLAAGLTITATAPYVAAVREAAADAAVGPLECRRSDDVGADPVTDGASAVHVAGSPVLARAPGEGEARVAAGVATTGTAVLARPAGEWRECCGRAVAREAWASEEPVVAWSEAPAAPPAVRDGDVADVDDDGAQLVRGTRSAQYASGQGGVGYYLVEGDQVEIGVPTATAAGTPLRRLAYLHTADDDRFDHVVAALATALSAGPEDGDAAAKAPFVDPAFERR